MSLRLVAAPRRAAVRWAVAAVVLLGHGLLLWSWRASAPSRFAPPPTAEARTVWVVVPRATMSPALSPPEPRSAPRAESRPLRASRSAPPLPTPRAAPTTPTEAATSVAPAVAAAQAELPASAPLDLALRIPRGDAERGGLAKGRDDMQRLALNDPRANTRTDPTQALPDAVARAGKGDCMKGEFVGAGMGLLSAPFLAYAAVAGNCRPQR
jgi:hypothetical protein